LVVRGVLRKRGAISCSSSPLRDADSDGESDVVFKGGSRLEKGGLKGGRGGMTSTACEAIRSLYSGCLPPHIQPRFECNLMLLAP